MANDENDQRIPLEVNGKIWNRFFSANTLVIIGSKEEDGSYNLAPKHMAMPLGFSEYFGFIGTPRKTTYRNVKREGSFTVSYPKPDQIILSSLSASQRETNDQKKIIENIPTRKAEKVDGILLDNAYIHLECEASNFLGPFGEWELVVGKVIAAYAATDFIRDSGEDQNDDALLYGSPILTYLHPDRFSIVKESHHFPLPKNFKR